MFYRLTYKFKSIQDVYKSFAIKFLIASVAAAVLQGGGLSMAAVFNDLPPSAHKWLQNFPSYKYFNYGFIWFFSLSFLKYGFYIASLISAYFYLTSQKPLLISFRKILFQKQLLIQLLLIFAAFIPSVIITIVHGDIKLLIYGFKSLLPIASILIGLLATKNDVKKLSLIVDMAIAGCFFISILQAVQGYQYCQGICIRATGLFIEPNTLASLMISRIALLYFDDNQNNFFKILLCGSLIILSGSRSMGLVFLGCLFNFCYGSKIYKKFFLVMILGVGLLFLSLFFGRGFESLYVRIANFAEISIINIFFGSGLGVGTQTQHIMASTLKNNEAPLLNADMQFLSFIHQGGIWMLTFLFVASVFTIYQSRSRRNMTFIFAIFWISGVGIMVLEVWPINILLFMLIGFMLQNRSGDGNPNESRI